MREFNLSILAASVLFLMQSANAFTIEETTVDKLQEAFKKHEITCVQLVEAYLQRIKQYDLSHPDRAPINAFTEINPSVLEDASRKDAEYIKSGKLSGPLHCVPVILKDNIDSYDTTTTAGSYALIGNQPVKDADLTARLRQAGAVVIGKGAMDEFAWGMFGYSSRSGRVGNVYDTSKNAGGSSGGTSAAVSANFATLGVGTDNSGSVRIPAIFNGLVGLRPTMGLVSQQGLFPMGNPDGAAGPIARQVADLALMLDVMAESSRRDSNSYTSYLNENGLQHKRIGIIQQAGKVKPFDAISAEALELFKRAQKVMEQQGAEFVDVSLPGFVANRDDNQAGEIEDINHYLASFPAVRKDFRDICESDRTRNFGSVQDCLKFMRQVSSHSSRQYQRMTLMMKKNQDYVTSLMKSKHLDALIMPLNKQEGGSYDPMAINTWQVPVSSNSGLPAIAFVIGYGKQQMPYGVDVTGPAFSEGVLIEIAYAYERATHWRRAPDMPVADVGLLSLSISQVNNLFSLIGRATYDQFIKNQNPKQQLPAVITPLKFEKLVSSVRS